MHYLNNKFYIYFYKLFYFLISKSIKKELRDSIINYIKNSNFVGVTIDYIYGEIKGLIKLEKLIIKKNISSIRFMTVKDNQNLIDKNINEYDRKEKKC